MAIINRGILGTKYMNMMPSLGSGIALWTPANMSSTVMKQWIDATDEDTVTLNSGAISQIDDKSGNDAHATQVTASLQPDYIDGSAGYKAIDFSSAEFGKLNLVRPTSDTETTVFMVFKESETSKFILLSIPTAKYLGICEDGSTDTVISDAGVGVNAIYLKDGNNINAQDRGDMFDAFGGDVLTMFEARDLDFSGWGTPWNLGAYSTAFDMEGEFYEMIVIDSNATIEEILKSEGYLAHKYSLQANLPLAHPYRDSVPTTTTPAWTLLALSPVAFLNSNDESSVTLNGSDVARIENQVSTQVFHMEQLNAAQQPPYNTDDGNANGLKTLDTNGLSTAKYGLEFAEDLTVQDVFAIAVYKDGTDSIFDNNATIFKKSNTTIGRLTGDTGTDEWFDSNLWGTPTYINGHNVGSVVLPMPLSVINVTRTTADTAVYTWMFDEQSGPRDWEGSSSALVLFDRALSLPEGDRVVGYLAHEAGVESNLPFGHPYRTTEPTFSDPAWTPWQLDPLLWIDLEQSDSITLNDSDISNIQGIARNGDAFTQGTASEQPEYDAVNGAMLFTGSENLESLNKALFNVLHETAGSITMRVKLNNANSGDLMPIFSTASNTGSSKGVFIAIDDRGAVGTNRLSLGVSNGSGGSGAFAYLTRSSSDFSLGDSDVTDDFIFHIEWDGTSCEGYKNNVLLGTQTIVTTLGTGDSSLNPILGEAGADNFDGDISKDIVITNRKLTSDERTQLYNYLNS